MTEQLVREITALLHDAEEKVWKKIELTMLRLYWNIGYRLQAFTEEEVQSLATMLSRRLDIEREMFLNSYAFYRDHPDKRTALRGKK